MQNFKSKIKNKQLLRLKQRKIMQRKYTPILQIICINL